MDPEVNQEMVMETTQDEMKMKTIMTWPNQASHLLNHSKTYLSNCILSCLQIKLHD
jgi:hypothetical protein